MAGVEPWQVIATGLVTIAVAYLGLLGARATATRAKEGVLRTVDVSAQESALQAWQAMVKPLQEETARLSRELSTERQSRLEKERADEKDRAEQKQLISEQMEVLTEKVELLRVEVRHWKAMAKAIARWATTLRDQVISLGGSVPTIPDEILVAQLLDERDDDRRA